MTNNQETSLMKGTTFQFRDGEREISIWYSSFSGLEKVFVDGELVSKRRNFSLKSQTGFVVDNDEYEVFFEYDSLVNGPFICTLHKNGDEFKRLKLVFPDDEEPNESGETKTVKKKRGFIFELIPYVVIGGIIGFIMGSLDVPRSWFYFFLLIMFITIVIREARKSTKLRPYIIEEETP